MCRLLVKWEIVFRQPQHVISSPDPDYASKKQVGGITSGSIKDKVRKSPLQIDARKAQTDYLEMPPDSRGMREA